MNKQDLINEVASKTSATKSETTKIVDAVITSIKEALKKDEKVAIFGLGNFETVTKAAREGRNPATGASISIPSKKVVKFKPTKNILD